MTEKKGTNEFQKEAKIKLYEAASESLDFLRNYLSANLSDVEERQIIEKKEKVQIALEILRIARLSESE